jgi:ribosomal protein S12
MGLKEGRQVLGRADGHLRDIQQTICLHVQTMQLQGPGSAIRQIGLVFA